MNPIDKLVGNNLRERRVAKGLSQEELADMIHISYQQIQKYERGLNRVSASRLVELSDALDCEIPAFFVGIKAEIAVAEPRNLNAIRREQEVIKGYNNLPEVVQSAVANLLSAMEYGKCQ